MDYSNYAQPWQETRDKQTRIPIKANSRFFYAHYPENWELVHFEQTHKEEGKKPKKIEIPLFLPMLSSIPEEAGVNGCRAVGGRIDSSVLKAQLSNKGWRILEANQHDYIRTYPATRGTYYTSKWVKLEKVGSRILHSFDQDSFNAWRLELMASGAIQMPHPQIIKLKLIDNNRQISSLEQNQHIPEIAARLKAAQKRHTDIKKGIARLERYKSKTYDI